MTQVATISVNQMRNSFPRFVIVGVIGFVVDAGLLTFLSVHIALNVYIARLASFAVASLVTWRLNRRLTFDAQARRVVTEWSRYVLVQIGGALINMGVFSLAVWTWPLLRSYPVLPLAIGAMGGLIFNYLLSRYWVFRKQRDD